MGKKISGHIILRHFQEVKINILTSSFDSFKKLKNYYFENDKSSLVIKSFKKIGKNYSVFLEGCNDREKALFFKGKKIFALRKNFPKIKEDEYYVIDLIDCDVFNINKNFLGKIIDIKNFGAGDLLELVSSDKKSFYIPINEENIVSIDIKKKKIIANPILGLLE